MAYAVGYAQFGALLVRAALIPGLAYLAYRKPRRVFHNPRARLARGAATGARCARSLDRPRIAYRAERRRGASRSSGSAPRSGASSCPSSTRARSGSRSSCRPASRSQKASEMAAELRKARARVPRGVLHRHAARAQRRRHRPVDAVAHRGGGRAAPLRDLAGGRDQARPDRAAWRARLRRSMPGLRRRLQPADDRRRERQDLRARTASSSSRSSATTSTSCAASAATSSRCSKACRASADVAIDQEPPLPQLAIKVDREAAARFGINVARHRRPHRDRHRRRRGEPGVHRRAPLRHRRCASRPRRATARRRSATWCSPRASGALIPLSQVATIKLQTGESTITREMNQRHLR